MYNIKPTIQRKTPFFSNLFLTYFKSYFLSCSSFVETVITVNKSSCAGLPQECTEQPQMESREVKCACPTVECNWNEWSEWSATCGAASRTRTIKTTKVRIIIIIIIIIIMIMTRTMTMIIITIMMMIMIMIITIMIKWFYLTNEIDSGIVQARMQISGFVENKKLKLFKWGFVCFLFKLYIWLSRISPKIVKNNSNEF